jgi:hypothetical protein
VHFRQHIEPEFILKRQCHKIFDFMFVHESFFCQAPEYPIREVSNFSENSWIYLCSRCATSVIKPQKGFNYLDLGTSLWILEKIWNYPNVEDRKVIKYIHS